jgi:ABC-type nitrate/sulfonate/bicarbonate transport system substrate-binding protein
LVVRRSWLEANRDVAQRYVDAIVEAIAKARQDKELALSVLQKYEHTDDRRALEATYDFFVGQVTPQYPIPRPEQFTDAVAQLAASNPKIQEFNVAGLLDPSLVQSAMDRQVGGPPPTATP